MSHLNVQYLNVKPDNTEMLIFTARASVSSDLMYTKSFMSRYADVKPSFDCSLKTGIKTLFMLEL